MIKFSKCTWRISSCKLLL